MGNKCLRAGSPDESDLRGDTRRIIKHKRNKSIPVIADSLQLINKESFITSLENNEKVDRAVSGTSSDYGVRFSNDLKK